VGVKFLGNPAAAKPPEIGIIYVHIICIYILLINYIYICV
jgi:hypothetical protein